MFEEKDLDEKLMGKFKLLKDLLDKASGVLPNFSKEDFTKECIKIASDSHAKKLGGSYNETDEDGKLKYLESFVHTGLLLINTELLSDKLQEIMQG